jgi:phosphotransferase system enzyme I (PtsI)
MSGRTDISATAAAKGMAVGRARVLYPVHFDIETDALPLRQTQSELLRWERALQSARAELAGLRQRLSGKIARDIGEFIDAHALMLEDPTFSDGVAEQIRRHHRYATAALKAHRDHLAAAFDAIDDPYLRSRREDLDQVVARVFAALKRGSNAQDQPVPVDAGTVLVCESVGAGELDYWHEHGLVGVISLQGSPYSHSAILARSLHIPLICGATRALELIRDGDMVLVDGNQGHAIVAPDALDLSRLRQHQRDVHKATRSLNKLKKTLTVTQDGVPIGLFINSEQPSEIAEARRLGVDGVGLYRSEFLWMRHGDPPGEEEQFRAYRDALIAMAGKPVTIRTLDIGADKPGAGALAVGHEPNPALGLRGLRLSLARRDHFVSQLRAILRASAYGPIRVMFPMVTNLDEVHETLQLLKKCRATLEREGFALAERVPIGAMIEVPGAALISAELSKIFDFLALGSNDLVQYTLATDRNNAAVSEHYDPFHPGIIRLLAMVVDNARRAKCPLSICGELAGSALHVPALIALGINTFSMHSSSILEVRERILRLSHKALRAKARQLCAASQRSSIEAIVAKM